MSLRSLSSWGGASSMSVFSKNYFSGFGAESKPQRVDSALMLISNDAEMEKKTNLVKINPLSKSFTFKPKTHFLSSTLKLRLESSRMKPIPTERLKFDAELWLQDQKRIKMYIPFD